MTDTAIADSSFRAISLRYFNPIGAHPSGKIGEDPDGVPKNLFPFIAQVAVGKRQFLNIFGNDYSTVDGASRRDYLHVVDLAKGHVKALGWLNKKPNFRGVEVFNLGTGTAFAVLEIVNSFIKTTGIDIPFSSRCFWGWSTS